MNLAVSRSLAAGAAVLCLSLAGCDSKPRFTESMTLGGQEISAQTLNEGRESYTLYCRACHGDNGDGAGPASHGLRPPPRDFRAGLFKFGWVTDGLPRDEDFHRIVTHGLHGTAMLPWHVPEKELPGIVAYVKTFAPEHWEGDVVGQPVEVSPDPWGAGRKDDAVARGRELYHGKAQCWTCHPAYAAREYIAQVRGSSSFRDNLYLPEAKPSSYLVGEVPVRLLPTDFAWHSPRSIRDGSELEDLFRLIGSGIPGTAMPQWKGALPDEDIWALAYFVKSVMELRDTPQAVQMREQMRTQPELPAVPAPAEGAPPPEKSGL